MTPAEPKCASCREPATADSRFCVDCGIDRAVALGLRKALGNFVMNGYPGQADAHKKARRGRKPTSHGDPPSPRQLEALDLWRESVRNRCRPPTFRELGTAMGIGVNAVNDLIQALVRKGWMVREGRNYRPAKMY